jgi:hypothetical protein
MVIGAMNFNVFIKHIMLSDTTQFLSSASHPSRMLNGYYLRKAINE